MAMSNAAQATSRSRRPLVVLLALLAFVLAPTVRAQPILDELPEEVRGLDVIEKVGDQVPLDRMLVDADGQAVTLAKYFEDPKPAILVLVYYDCPVVCPRVLEDLRRAINGVDLTVGKDFNVIVVSFDPTNTVAQAAEQREISTVGYVQGQSPEIARGWNFHVAGENSSSAIADAVGFQYRFLPKSGEYSHPVALMVLTPDAKVSRYVYGFGYQPRDIKIALMEASQGKLVRSIGDRLMLFCYMYDPNSGGYTLQAMRVMQLAGVLTMILLFGGIAVLFARERARRRVAALAPVPGETVEPVTGLSADTKQDSATRPARRRGAVASRAPGAASGHRS
jgi:protein SCO1/2